MTISTPQMALFNAHVNDAEKKARAILHGINPELLAEVDERTQSGDMEIFEHEPTEGTKMYVHLVTAFVNEHKVA